MIRQSSQLLSRRRILGAVLVAASALVLLVPSPSSAYPPTPPSAGEAAAMLEGLSVEAEGSTSGYSRDLFPHWIMQTGNCDTREVVLQRDGTGVTVDSACRPIGGSWYSVYDAVW